MKDVGIESRRGWPRALQNRVAVARLHLSFEFNKKDEKAPLFIGKMEP